jgi:serine/threonine protein kinase
MQCYLHLVTLVWYQGQNVDVKQMTEFLEEATVMCNLRHINVLGLIGIAIDDNDRPLIVLPLMDNGDLRSFIANPDLVGTASNYSLHRSLG